MTFTVTSITTFPSVNTPRFKSWLETADPALLLGFPQVTGLTPLQAVIAEETAKKNSAGFVSQTVSSETDTSITIEQYWTDQQSWLTAIASPTSGNVPVLDANNQPVLNSHGQPKYYTPRRYLWKIYSDQFTVTQVITKSE